MNAPNKRHWRKERQKAETRKLALTENSGNNVS